MDRWAVAPAGLPKKNNIEEQLINKFRHNKESIEWK